MDLLCDYTELDGVSSVMTQLKSDKSTDEHTKSIKFIVDDDSCL